LTSLERDDVMRRASLMLAGTFWLLVAASATADEIRNWDLEIGVGTAYAPDYSGSSATSARLRIWADGAYRTNGLGTIALDSGSLTIAPEVRWDLVDSDDAGAGLLIGYRAGRDDHDPGFLSANDGSARLRGLPTVGAVIDAGAGGHVAIFGVPVFAQVRRSLQRAQGTLAIFGIYLPVHAATDLEFTILPTISWANALQARAFYGVSQQAATASSYASYDPGGGWQSAAIEIGGDWRISGEWHLIASVACQRLLANAARSPIVQTPRQSSALAGIALHF
jgi:outer membrane scaffolding protein for murein synthesis (MipA/OmpV family)